MQHARRAAEAALGSTRTASTSAYREQLISAMREIRRYRSSRVSRKRSLVSVVIQPTTSGGQALSRNHASSRLRHAAPA